VPYGMGLPHELHLLCIALRALSYVCRTLQAMLLRFIPWDAATQAWSWPGKAPASGAGGATHPAHQIKVRIGAARLPSSARGRAHTTLDWKKMLYGMTSAPNAATASGSVPAVSCSTMSAAHSQQGGLVWVGWGEGTRFSA
jgi:hypothetical protein